MAFIKNIPHETVLPLAAEVAVQPGQVVSKTLAQNSAVSVTLFAFDKGEEIGTHDSTGDAMVTVLEGAGRPARRRAGRHGAGKRAARPAQGGVRALRGLGPRGAFGGARGASGGGRRIKQKIGERVPAAVRAP